MTQTPTDALRLVRNLAAKGADTPGCNNWRAASMCRQIVEVLDKAAPASPLPEGGYFVPAMTFDHIAAILWSKGLGEYATTMSRNSIALLAAPTGEPK